MTKQEFKHSLYESVRKALQKSRRWPHGQSNKDRSEYFCYQVGEMLHPAIAGDYEDVERNQITFDKDKGTRVKGEWLLDIVWSRKFQPDQRSSTKQPWIILAALECESNKGGKQFFEDFAKLVNIRSDIKIFLAGLDHKTPKGMNDYIEKRMKQAAKYLSKAGVLNSNENWYLAFWPSPLKVDGESLWDQLDKYKHLKQVQVFALEGSSFETFDPDGK